MKEKIRVWDANDICKSGDIPSSMALCVDEPTDRWMEHIGDGRPSDKLNYLNRYRIDDMYEAVDY